MCPTVSKDDAGKTLRARAAPSSEVSHKGKYRSVRHRLTPVREVGEIPLPSSFFNEKFPASTNPPKPPKNSRKLISMTALISVTTWDHSVSVFVAR